MKRKCLFCEKYSENSGAIAIHQKYCELNPNRILYVKPPNFNKGKIPWNKGLTKNDERIAKMTEKANATKNVRTYEVKKSTRELLSQLAKKNNFGGYTENGGKGKKGRYAGIWCHSSWELAFVLYHVDNGIKIEKCKEYRTYNFEGKIRKYYPDFVINGKIYEIKGWKTKQWDAKMRENPDVIVLYRDDIKPFLEYAINKYGKDFVELYETSGEVA